MAVPIRTPPSEPIEFEDQVDFNGGLNLSDEWFKLAENETPECENVMFDSLGGFRTRHGAERMNTTAESATAQSLFSHGDGSAYQIMAHVGTNLRYSTGGNFSTAGSLGSLAGPAFGASYDGVTYVTRNAQNTSVSWDGSTFTAMTDPHGAYDPDYNTPSGTKMPRAKFVCVQHDRLWVAYTSEGGVDQRNRVRFSFAGDAGSWLSNDFIDIDVGDSGGDEITGLAPVGDHVLVFKKHSIHAILGYNDETFQVIDVANGIGAVSQNAITTNIGRVFFFDHTEGLQAYSPASLRGDDQTPIVDLFGKLRRLLHDDLIDDNLVATETMVGVVGNQLWLYLPNLGLDQSYTWVMDLDTGAWTRYTLQVGPFLEWDDGTGDTIDLAVQRDGVSTEGLVKVNANRTTDDLNGTPANIVAVWRSAWYTAGTPTEFKRWKRPRVVASLEDGSTVTLGIQICKNYLTEITSVVNRSITSAAAGMEWDTDSWDSAVWGASGVGSRVDVLRGPSPGRARSICVKICNDGNDAADWAVQSIGTRWRRGAVRS